MVPALVQNFPIMPTGSEFTLLHTPIGVCHTIHMTFIWNSLCIPHGSVRKQATHLYWAICKELGKRTIYKDVNRCWDPYCYVTNYPKLSDIKYDTHGSYGSGIREGHKEDDSLLLHDI